MTRTRESMNKLDLTNPNDYRYVVKVCEENLNVSDKKLIEQAEHVKDILRLGDKEEVSRNVLEWIKIYETREQVRDLIIEFLIRDLNSSFEMTNYLLITIVGSSLLILAYKGIRRFY